jgi:hypothetical protein
MNEMIKIPKNSIDWVVLLGVICFPFIFTLIAYQLIFIPNVHWMVSSSIFVLGTLLIMHFVFITLFKVDSDHFKYVMCFYSILGTMSILAFDNFPETRSLYQTQWQYSQDYNKFKETKLEPLSDSDKDKVTGFINSSKNPIYGFYTKVNYENFKTIDKDAFFQDRFNKELVYFIESGSNHEWRLTYHFLLKDHGLSPYSDDKFKRMFGNPSLPMSKRNTKQSNHKDKMGRVSNNHKPFSRSY